MVAKMRGQVYNTAHALTIGYGKWTPRILPSRFACRFAVLLPLLLLNSCTGPFFLPSYTIQYFRHDDRPGDEALIAIAEAECPSYDDVIAVFEGIPPQASDECLWWYKEDEDLRYPYAITAEAIDYYEDLVLRWREQWEWARVWVDYEASVEHLSSADDEALAGGTVAVFMRMRLDVRRPHLVLSLTQERVVVIDDTLNVVAVFGDGLPRIPVFKTWKTWGKTWGR